MPVMRSRISATSPSSRLANSCIIDREPFLNSIDDALNVHQLVSVVAPAGAGKTVASQLYINRVGDRAIRFALTLEVAQPLPFFRRLLSLLVPPRYQQSLFVQPNHIAEAIKSFHHDKRLVIFLDNAHLLYAVEMRAAFNMLMKHLPSNVSLVLLSRKKIYGVKNIGVEIDSSGLAVSEPEFDALIELYQPINLDQNERQQVFQLSLGNIFRLHLLLWLRHHYSISGVLPHNDASHAIKHLASNLNKELLAAVSTFNGHRVIFNEMLDDDQAALLNNIRMDGFLAHDTDLGCLRIYHGFTKFINRQIAIPVLSSSAYHRAVVELMLAREQLQLAVDYLIDIGELETARDVIFKHQIDFINSGRTRVLVTLLRKLATKLPNEKKVFYSLAFALVEQRHYRQAKMICSRHGDCSGNEMRINSAEEFDWYSLSVSYLIGIGDIEQAHAVCLAGMNHVEYRSRDSYWKMIGNLGVLEGIYQRYDTCFLWLNQALMHAQQSQNGLMSFWASTYLSWFLLHQGNAKQAFEYIGLSDKLIADYQIRDHSVATLHIMNKVCQYVYRQEVELGIKEIEQFLQLKDFKVAQPFEVIAVCFYVYALLVSKDGAKAVTMWNRYLLNREPSALSKSDLQWVKTVELLVGAAIKMPLENAKFFDFEECKRDPDVFLQIGFCKWLAATKQDQAFKTSSAFIMQISKPKKHYLGLMNGLLFDAAWALQSENHRDADQYIYEALLKGYECGSLLPFTTASRSVKIYLKHLAVFPEQLFPTKTDPAHAFLTEVIPHLSDVKLDGKFGLNGLANDQLADPLTPKELTTLKLLATGYSNQEIANHLSVKKSTVKTHINRLYDKLGVSSRPEAIELANQMFAISD